MPIALIFGQSMTLIEDNFALTLPGIFLGKAFSLQ